MEAISYLGGGGGDGGDRGERPPCRKTAVFLLDLKYLSSSSMQGTPMCPSSLPTTHHHPALPRGSAAVASAHKSEASDLGRGGRWERRGTRWRRGHRWKGWSGGGAERVVHASGSRSSGGGEGWSSEPLMVIFRMVFFRPISLVREDCCWIDGCGGIAAVFLGRHV